MFNETAVLAQSEGASTAPSAISPGERSAPAEPALETASSGRGLAPFLDRFLPESQSAAILPSAMAAAEPTPVRASDETAAVRTELKGSPAVHEADAYDQGRARDHERRQREDGLHG